MTISAACLVSHDGGSYLSTVDGVDVPPGSTVSIKLDDTTGVSGWYLRVKGTDELTSAPALSNVDPDTNHVTSPSTVVTFTAPSDSGHALLFESTVTGTGGPLTVTFGIYIPTNSGTRVGATGERREGSAEYGWVTKLNPILRSGGGGASATDGTYPTSGSIALRNVVAMNSSGQLVQTHSSSTLPAIGFVSAIPASGQATLQTRGILAGFSSLTPGHDYYVDVVPGAIFPSYTTGAFCQKVGVAVSSTELLITIEPPVSL